MLLALLRKKPVLLMSASQRARRRLGKIARRGIFFEEGFGDQVDPFVGALGGEDGGDEQLERLEKLSSQRAPDRRF